MDIDLNEVMKDQPTMNIGMIGSVSDGKSTIVKGITDTATQRHSSELERNITIKLGYANAKIFQCPTCPAPSCYQPFHSKTLDAECKICGDKMVLKKHISFVDCPGHNLLMATMLNGACVMDTTILVESVGNQTIPAPQTREHVIAAQLTGLPNFLVCLNKLDLVKKSTAMEKMAELQNFVKGTPCEGSPIIPVAANRGINIDVICEYLCTELKEVERDYASSLKMVIIRSFNINKQHQAISELEGAVVGGTVMNGVLKPDMRIKIIPGGLEKQDIEGKPRWRYRPFFSKVVSINTETNDLQYATPGGLIGVKLTLDPSLAAKDGLVGQTLVQDTYNEYRVFEKIFVILDIIEDRKSIPLAENTILVINHNACNVRGKIVKIKKNRAEIDLIERPICCKEGEYVTISISKDPANVSNILLLGRAKIADGEECEQKDS